MHLLFEFSVAIQVGKITIVVLRFPEKVHRINFTSIPLGNVVIKSTKN